MQSSAVLLAASFFAGAGMTARNATDVSASIAGRVALHGLRFGAVVDAAFGLGPNVTLRPLATCDYDVSGEPDVRVWLGAALGPSLSFPANVAGLAGLATLDVAIPLASRHFAFDVVVRAGFDEALTVPSDRPAAVGEFSLGVTWDL